jgi:CheY-like chemotaxis protein
MPSLLTEPRISAPATRLSIVVADDVAELRQLIGLWLEDLGHTVSHAGNGREAVRLVLEQPCDLLCTDILMPDRDGLDLIMEIRRTKPAVRVLAFSGGDRFMQAHNALRLAKVIGANNLLPKPFNRAQFVEAVQRVIGRRTVLRGPSAWDKPGSPGRSSGP